MWADICYRFVILGYTSHKNGQAGFPSNNCKPWGTKQIYYWHLVGISKSTVCKPSSKTLLVMPGIPLVCSESLLNVLFCCTLTDLGRGTAHKGLWVEHYSAPTLVRSESDCSVRDPDRWAVPGDGRLKRTGKIPLQCPSLQMHKRPTDAEIGGVLCTLQAWLPASK